MNELTITTCKIITDKVSFIIASTSRKTMSESDLETAIKLVFVGQLCQKSVEEGYKSLKNYSISCMEDDSKGKSRNEKADILLPPSIFVNFLKSSGMNISSNAPIFLAGVIEYFISQILDLSNNVSLNKNIRITVDDIENGIRLDKELTNYFVSNNIFLYGSSIIPYTHPLFRNKINDTKYNKHIQEYAEYIFPKTSIENRFKNYINLIYPDIRYQKDCFDYFQNYLEKWLVELLKYSNNITLYSKKTRVTENEIELALSIMERRNPSFFENNEISDINDLNVIKFSDINNNNNNSEE
jgi:histone H3/H4